MPVLIKVLKQSALQGSDGLPDSQAGFDLRHLDGVMSAQPCCMIHGGLS